MKNKNTISTLQGRYTSQLIAATILFAVTVLITKGGYAKSIDHDIFKFIYGLPDSLLPFFLAVTQAGSIFMLLVFLLLFALNKKFNIVVRLLLTSTLAYQLSGFAKSLWGNPRPFEIIADVLNRDVYVQGPAFPSGHVAFATALALTLHQYMPKRFRWITPVWIGLVGLSRLYLGVHTPLDLVGGFAIGWFCFALYQHVLITVPLVRQKHRMKRAK